MPGDIKTIEDIAEKVAKDTFNRLNKSGALTDIRVVAAPTDAFSPVNRRFVTLSSNLGARPVSSVAVVGQFFFDTTSNTPLWYTIAGWRNSAGSIVAINN